MAGLAFMAGITGLAYVFLVAFLAIAAAYVIVCVLLLAGLVAYLHAIVAAQTAGDRATLIFMPLIAVASYFVCHELYYAEFWRTCVELKNETASGEKATLVIAGGYWGGVIAFFGASFLTWVAANEGMGVIGRVGTGFLWAWAGIALTIGMVANDVLN